MRITDDLREYVDWLYENKQMFGIDHGVLMDIADRIDAEHERRMDDKVVEVVRCADCESAMESHYHDCLVCCRHGIHVEGSHFCSDGERRGEDE